MAILSRLEKLEQAAKYLVEMLKINCPKDTTNLSRSINIQYVEEGKARIVIGHEDADYAVYTNEPWIDKRWNGKKNPNDGWVEKTIMEATPMIQQLLSGEIDEAEFNDLIKGLQSNYDEQVKERINDINLKLEILNS